MLRIGYVLGTRPEVIRSARILRLLSNDDDVDTVVVNTGQHYDHNMLGAFLDELEVPYVSVDLEVGPADPGVQTATVIEGITRVLRSERVACLCVFGDTNSTLGAAVAAVKGGVPLVHVEAGCRSYDMRMPEEVNRRVVDHMSALLLPVSEHGADVLAGEKVPGEIVVAGDPQFDVFSEQRVRITAGAERTKGLVTLHRPENADHRERLAAILEEVVAAPGADTIEWVFPVHPRTLRALPDVPPMIRVCDPLPYGALLATLLESRVCVTDSGGLQKEAFWARVPCVTVRPTTEWVETVSVGANVLAQPGANVADAVAWALATELPAEYENPYGDGRASERIVSTIKEWLR